MANQAHYHPPIRMTETPEPQMSLDPDQWLDEHGDHLYRYALVRLRDHGIAQDMVQETLLAAIKAQDRFDGRRPIRAWLMGILKHKVVDHIRKKSRESYLEDLQQPGQENPFLMEHFGIANRVPPPWKFNPRKAFEQKEFWDVFAACLSKLDEKMHRAFVLRELEDEETEEVCKQMKITPNYLWVILHRAREQLKGCLGENWIKRNEGS